MTLGALRSAPYLHAIAPFNEHRVSYNFRLRPLRRDGIAASSALSIRHYALKHRITSRSQLDSNGGHLPNRISGGNHHTIPFLLCPCRFVARKPLAATRRFLARPASAHTQGSDPCEGSGQCAVSHRAAPLLPDAVLPLPAARAQQYRF